MKKANGSPPTRVEILKGIGWKPLKMPGVPAAVAKAENRRMQDYLVNWTQGMAAHIEMVEAGRTRPEASAAEARESIPTTLCHQETAALNRRAVSGVHLKPAAREWRVSARDVQRLVQRLAIRPLHAARRAPKAATGYLRYRRFRVHPSRY
jgi:hypothetical protein